MKTIDFIRGREWDILSYYGHERTDNRHIDCPICGGKKKFRLNEHQGVPMFICTCGAGDTFKLLMETTGKDFKTLADEIDRTFGNFEADKAPVKKDTSRRDRAIQLFRDSNPIRGTDAETYLQSRGIFETPTGGVKFGSVYDYSEKRTIPAIIAIASTEFGEPRQLHVTYIEDGKKAAINTQRKMHSLSPKTMRDRESSEPIAVKLFQSGTVLGIAEGIESALSAKQLFRVPTWAAMNATYLRRFRAPTGVETLYLFADNDRNLTGLAAAMDCARGNLLSSNDVKKAVVRWPEKMNDFNDVLVEGDKILEWTGEK